MKTKHARTLVVKKLKISFNVFSRVSSNRHTDALIHVQYIPYPRLTHSAPRHEVKKSRDRYCISVLAT